VVESSGLLNRRRVKSSTGGSNPPLSATHSDLSHRNRDLVATDVPFRHNGSLTGITSNQAQHVPPLWAATRSLEANHSARRSTARPGGHEVAVSFRQYTHDRCLSSTTSIASLMRCFPRYSSTAALHPLIAP
jgi:hypothetical protein